jgi:hypothetical protein
MTRFGASILLAGFCLGGLVSQAAATVLFKGIAVITARTNNAACVLEYDIGETFIAEYRANLASDTGPERAMAVGPNGALLMSSTDANRSLRGAGTVNITGAAYAAPVSFANQASNFTISPTTITSTTISVTMSGTVANLGIPSCTVTFRASLTKMLPNGY